MLLNLDLNPQCQHPDSFDLSSLEYQEITAHIQESTFSIHRAEFDPDVIVSCQDLLKYQNSEVLSKYHQFCESSLLHSLLLYS